VCIVRNRDDERVTTGLDNNRKPDTCCTICHRQIGFPYVYWSTYIPVRHMDGEILDESVCLFFCADCGQPSGGLSKDLAELTRHRRVERHQWQLREMNTEGMVAQ
jgi:hypothetical protein